MDDMILENLLDKIFKDAEEKLGFKVSSTLLIVPSNTASFTINTARMEIKNEDKLVSTDDIVEVVRLSGENVVQDNMEFVNILPVYFTLDNGAKTSNPGNAFSKSIEVKSLITSSTKADVYRYLNILYKISVY